MTDARARAARAVAQGVPCYRMWSRKSDDNGVSWQPDMQFSDVVSPLPAQPDPGIQATYAGDYDYGSAGGPSSTGDFMGGRPSGNCRRIPSRMLSTDRAVHKSRHRPRLHLRTPQLPLRQLWFRAQLPQLQQPQQQHRLGHSPPAQSPSLRLATRVHGGRNTVDLSLERGDFAYRRYLSQRRIAHQHVERRFLHRFYR